VDTAKCEVRQCVPPQKQHIKRRRLHKFVLASLGSNWWDQTKGRFVSSCKLIGSPNIKPPRIRT